MNTLIVVLADLFLYHLFMYEFMYELFHIKLHFITSVSAPVV